MAKLLDRLPHGGVLLAVGVAGTWIASSMRGAPRNVALALSSGLVGLGIFKLAERGRELAAETQAALREAGALPSSSDPVQEVIGAVARATGHEPEPGVTTSADNPATPGPHLGTPKNALRIAGKIRAPLAGETALRPLFGDTIAVSAAVENQSGAPQTGTVRARTLFRQGGATGAVQSVIVESPPITLRPGEFRSVELRVKPAAPGAFFSFGGPMDLALQWGGYTLDRIQFKVRGSILGI